MTFVHPWLIWALALTAIPIIIHLFNFRRYKTVYFTNVKFLKEVTEETAVRSKLKHWLVLLSRLLAIIFLVLAFAQPVIPVRDAQPAATGKKGVSVFIDNSYSMSAESDDERLLNRAVRKAREIAGAYDESVRFQLLTNEFSSQQQRFISKEEFLGMLDEVKPSSFVRAFSEVYAEQVRAFKDASLDDKVSFWISDFQKNQTDFKGDTSLSLSLLPLQSVKQHNLYIDTAWLDQPAVYQDQPARILVKIVNTGERAVENSRMTLSVDDQVKAIADFSVPAASYTIDTVNFSVRDTGWKKIDISLTDYPVTFDDKYFLSLKVTGIVNVLAINEITESKYLQALFRSTERFSFQNRRVSQLDYSELRKFSLIILNHLNAIPSGLAYELEQYLKNGGGLLIFPGEKADVISYNKFLSSVGVSTLSGMETAELPVTFLNRQHEIFKDVFEEIPNNISLPSVKLFFHIQKQVRSNEQILLGLRNGSSFISQYEVELGEIYLCSTPLDEKSTDFPVHALFVPMVYKMALSGKGFGKTSYVLGKDEVIEIENKLRSNDAIYKIKGGDSEFIPRQKAAGAKMLIIPGEQISTAGIYNVYSDEEQPGNLVALNYDRKESQLEYYSASELQDMYPQENIRVIKSVNADIGGIVKELSEGVVLWKLCIILALVFLGAEVLLLRFLR